MKIANCPKCGSNDLTIGDCGYSSFNVAWVRCHQCKLEVKVTGDSAVKEWNNWVDDPLKMLLTEVKGERRHKGYPQDSFIPMSTFVTEQVRETLIDLNAELNVLCAALDPKHDEHFTQPQETSRELAIKCSKAVQKALYGISEETKSCSES